MKISVLLSNKIETFLLPSVAQGVFNFDPDPNEEIKLINVEAKNNKWVLYQTVDVSILKNDINIPTLELEEYHFYHLKRNNVVYTIYTSPTLEEMSCYKYGEKLEMLIGTTDECNVRYGMQSVPQFTFRIFIENNSLVLEKSSQALIYINNVSIFTNKYILQIGDEVNVYGLRLVLLKGIVFINNLGNVLVNEQSSGLSRYGFPKDSIPENREFTDVDLYSSNDYFSKTPRFRRVVEEKEINLQSPPNDSEAQEMPLILTLGPMLTMGIVSITTIMGTITRIANQETTFKDSWTSLLSALAMLISMLVWPLVIQAYNKRVQKKKKEEIRTKYIAYLEDKRNELMAVVQEQRSIMLENLVSIDTCLDYISRKKIGFWDKRNDQNDFLTVRIGIGKAPLSMKISYSEEEFSIEESDLRDKADELAKAFKYIEDTPVSYSFYENKTTAIMGVYDKVIGFTNNVLLQLITFYTYEDLKIVVFTSREKEDNWKYIKYLNHNFNNEKTFRFFATDTEDVKQVGDYLLQVINDRVRSIGNGKQIYHRPYYFIVTDKFENIKQHDFVDLLTETDENIGLSLVILEDRLSKLPSKCNNFITLGQTTSGVLKNSYENQEQLEFKDEIKYNINYMSIAKSLANVPIEFEEALGELPDSISFLEMEHVGKVEQLNIMNRWRTNDSTNSIRGEIGVDEHGDLMYLDLHEKFHGPHGLIAGTTGSGKSEFIITYILSMCINYSPDDVSFILIDYKGGGLALAFENRTTGVSLPHLAGTITNLDKAEMDRTLVSIDSEVRRRQALFNKARDELGESTMDIYKYQRFYHEGRLTDPISHLMIICDEFAELKSQQPDFMDNLISVARIGRSLGVHLILATQKPSGVVNDQIWSNSKFKVCLKVQDEADSKEMLKKPDAAYIKQAGRFYLQVGYDEYYALGQSGWCGAKYYPSEKIVKEVDKSVNFIDNCGNFIKSIKAGSSNKVVASGEQLLNVLNSIIETAKLENKFSKRLWLENIPAVILENDIRIKYNINTVSYEVDAVIGEYDAPEKQEQGVVRYNFEEDGNTLIYGTDSSENENLLKTIIYSSAKYHSVEELYYYIVDFGSESLRIFNGLPHVGGIVFQGEDEKFYNLLKLLRGELQRRKKILADYGGEYQIYNKTSEKKLPLITVILNNFDSIYETYEDLYETLPELVRDSERYGIVYVITGNAVNSVFNKVSQNFKNIYAFKLKDSSDYSSVFNERTKLEPRETFGRGLLYTDAVHEFQTVSIIEDAEQLNSFILEFIKEQKEKNRSRAKLIPVLPEHVRFENVSENISDIKNVPIGISKKELDVITYNFLQDTGTIITSNKLNNAKYFVLSLIGIFSKIPNNVIAVFDVMKLLGYDSSTPNYYTEDIDKVIDSLENYISNLLENNSIIEGVIVIYGFTKFMNKLSSSSKFEEFLSVVKKYEHMGIIIVEEANKLKNYAYDQWYTEVFNSSSGIWIGRGISDQSVLRISTINKEMTQNYKNDMGYLVLDNLATLCKLIDFYSKDGDEHE